MNSVSYKTREHTHDVVNDLEQRICLNVTRQSYNNISDGSHREVRRKIRDFVTGCIQSAIGEVTNG